MSAVCILTPIVIASWPAISAAVTGAVTSMGFSVLAPHLRKPEETVSPGVETTVENSEVLAENLARGQKIVVRRDDVTIEVGVDERGRCTVCAQGKRRSQRELRRIGEEVAGRIVQQFAYHKLLTELKSRKYQVVDEQVLGDASIKLRVRL